ncbi:MAG: glycoside hydrolase family 3 C-terminal domain-containing protein [Bacteroidales bacterium]|nr:glycoside hydrolase family 3 C-terminal domain-containing protein [Bacteroidales bacterium]
MKRITVSVLCLLLMAGSALLRAQEHPFQDTKLSEEERLDNAVSLMTVDEKIATLVGQGVPRLGIANPGATEAIHGIVRGGDAELPNLGNAGQFGRGWPGRPQPKYRNSTAFPQAYGVGETWDREMARTVGDVMSYEARFYSKDNPWKCLILWAPNADLARDPRWGRTEESFGEDPYLVGEMVAAEVKGIQGDDPQYWRGAALMKHFLANSNEDNRYRTDSRFDEELFRDYYSYGFWKGARAGAMSLMTAYNAYNGIPCIAAPFIKDILFDEWGMKGTIVDDAGALMFMYLPQMHHYAQSVDEAVRLALEAGLTRFIDSRFEQVKAAYDGGFIRDEVLDARTKSNLRTMLRLGLLDAECPYDAQEFGSEEDLPWERQAFKDKARLVTQKSIVLLKNEGNLLPLDRKEVKKIAVFGNRAEQVLKDWYGALPSYRVSPLDGIKAAVDSTRTEVRFQRWDSDGSAQELAKWADVCIVCVGNHPATSPDWDRQSVQSPWAYGTVAGDGREAMDRRSLQLETEDLIKVVWQANHNTVVTLISSFPFAINWTAENVPAIVHMTQCSQETGNALADVLFGDYNPAGRLTQTWVKDILDLPNMLDYDIRHGRTYMYARTKPLFPFGFGLSYTTFKYSHLKVKKDGDNYVVRFDLKNTGSRDGEEVVQLYAKFKDDDASKRLRGFERVAVKAGETVPVEIVVPAEDLKLWGSQAHAWAFRGRKAKLLVGASSEDIRLRKRIRL